MPFGAADLRDFVGLRVMHRANLVDRRIIGHMSWWGSRRPRG